ncbi:MAG: ATP-dependent zinc metalloprotease FtsH [bacterium]
MAGNLFSRLDPRGPRGIGDGRKQRPSGDPSQKSKIRFSLWYFLVAALILMMIQSYFAKRQVMEVPYSEFKSWVAAGKVESCWIQENRIEGTLKEAVTPAQEDGGGQKPTKEFVTIRVTDPDLVKELMAAGVQFRGTTAPGGIQTFLMYWILPLLLMVVVWGYVMRKMNPGLSVMAFKKSKAKLYAQKETGVTFEDVAGIDEAKDELKEVVEFLKDADRYKGLGARIPKGVLLVGPPGAGKTLLARAVAGEAGVPFFSLSGSDFVEMFVGLGAARVRDLFEQAVQNAPCIIFIDELDALGKARGMNPLGGHDEREQTLNQLLVEMDGFETNKGVIIMAATNRPEILDAALLRPGRFDRQVLVDRPDRQGREQILKVHSAKVKLGPDVDLQVLAASTPGFVGADLANAVNEAALLAARKHKSIVEMADFEEAIERVVAGLQKKNRILNEKEKQVVAYHECGHAVASTAVPGADPVRKISIVPRGIAALGYTLQLPTEDRYLMTKSELLGKMAGLLGGRIAEEIVFREISTGAQNDLQRATDIAQRMVKEYGMSERIGIVTYEAPRQPFLLGIPAGRERTFSEETAREIDKEVERIMEETYHRARQVLLQNRSVLDEMAGKLLEKEVLEGTELRGFLDRVQSQTGPNATN